MLRCATLLVLCLMAVSLGDAGFTNTCEWGILPSQSSVAHTCDVCGATWIETVYDEYTLDYVCVPCSASPYWSPDLDPQVHPDTSSGTNASGVWLCDHCAKYEPEFREARNTVLRACRAKESQRIRAVQAARKQAELDQLDEAIRALAEQRERLLAGPNDLSEVEEYQP